jgi:hypothetical protein
LIPDSLLVRNVANFIDVMMTHFAQDFARWNERIVEENDLLAVVMHFRYELIALRLRPFFPQDTRARGVCYFSRIYFTQKRKRT